MAESALAGETEEVIDEILGLQENYFVEYPNEALMTLGVESSGKAAKFDDPNYSLPGGENYRELVLTLPEGVTPYTKENVIPIPDTPENRTGRHGSPGKLRFLDPDNYWYFQSPDGLKDIPKKDYRSQEEALE